MDAVYASVACRKSVKINNSSLKSLQSEFGSSMYSGNSIVLKKPCKKFVRIENDSSIYSNTIARRVFRYVSQNGTVLKFTKFAEENDVDTNNNMLSLPSTRRKKLTYKSSSDKLFNLNNTQKTESLQCSNIPLSSRNQRKTITMLDVGLKDHGSIKCNKQYSVMVTKKENNKTAKDFSVNNSKIKTSTEYSNVNGGIYDKFTARKPIIIEEDINVKLIKNKEPPNEVFHQLKKSLTETEKESNDNTVKKTNLSMSPGRLKYHGVSLNRKKCGEARNNLENDSGKVSKKSTIAGFTPSNLETTTYNNHIENKSESNDKKSSPIKLLIPPFTIKTKECEFLNSNIDKMKLQNSESSINKQEKGNNLPLTDNMEKYTKQDATSVSKKCASESHLLDLNIPNCTITSQLESLQINSDNNTNTKLQQTTLIIERSIVRYSTNHKHNIKVLESDNCLKNVCMIHTGSRPFNIMSVLQKQLEAGRKIVNKSNLCNDVRTQNDKILDLHISGVPISTVQSKKKITQHKSTLMSSDTLQKINNDQDLFNSIDYFSTKFRKEVYFLDNFIKSIQSVDMSEGEICSTDYIQTLPTVNKDYEIEDKLSKNQSNCDLDNLGRNPFKSICWFNLLIEDEYRKAKNLLFILKLREDALKDFSRSQIIFLESKKKKDYTNVCMLKKKQRGILLKLQQECGEMHRIKKILLDITEKKNAIVMQNKHNTKHRLFKSCNLEVKFNTDKKIVQRLKPQNRSPRHCSPLKCFNLSGTSYTDESTELKEIECNTSLNNIFHFNASIKYNSVDKSDESENKEPYTVRSIKNKCEDKDFMLVDGTYLNILFKNLNLPEIFSHGKEYDVHCVALQGLVSSVNRLFECSKISLRLYRDNADIKTFSPGLIESNSSKNSAPSTARSLVGKFDDLNESLNETDDSISTNSYGIAKEDTKLKTEVNENFERQTPDIEIDMYGKSDSKDHGSNSEVCNSREEENFDLSSNNAASLSSGKHMVESDVETTFRNYSIFYSDDCNVEQPIQNHLGHDYKLPVRQCNGHIEICHENACELDKKKYDQQSVNDNNFEDLITSSNMIVYEKNDTVDCETFADNIMEENGEKINRPKDYKKSVSEAEALRMKQLAIELEIKALEQQSQLTYCIREIPDKPPPPYTPPTPETIFNNDRTTVLNVSNAFISKEVIKEHVNQFYCKMDIGEADYDLSTNQISKEKKSIELNIVDMCHEFISDYCQESIDKCKKVERYSSWDCSNITPFNLPKSSGEVKSLITTDICDILIYNTEEDIVKSVQELQMKRYDYIEEILFAEWKKYEKEWTSLENNEILVKNQLVDGIIIKEMDEILEDYLQHVS